MATPSLIALDVFHWQARKQGNKEESNPSFCCADAWTEKWKKSRPKRELKLKSEELQLQKKKFEQEAAERKERLKLELEERRMFLQILKEKM